MTDIRATGVSCEIGGKTILRDVSLEVKAGELTVLVGPNGAGKTTLLRRLAGLIAGDGEIRLGDRPVSSLTRRERAKQIAYLPQGHVFHWPQPVAEIVALGRLPHLGGGDLGDADKAAVAKAMNMAGVAELADRTVTTLSGGERARVALARVLATEAPILLADEPTASLDLKYQLAVAEMLRARAAEGATVLVVLHDLALAARYADRIVMLDEGAKVTDGPPQDVLTEDRLNDVFGVDVDMVEVRGARIAVPVASRED